MSSFDLLRKEIRKYIYDEGWNSLRRIQEASIRHACETDNNIVLAAPTASGKTEAAFLPAINSIADWRSGLKIVYISPLIALINDQFSRVWELCCYMDIPVTAWHGEASRTKKIKLMKKPKGILLITPESIEAMLSMRPGEAMGLFKYTEWVIVDEIHSFLCNNRGIQLRSLLERITAYMEKAPRFIGMSATLNKDDYSIVKEFFPWERQTDILLDRNRNILEDTNSYYESNIKRESREAVEEIFKYSQKESMLVFPNLRGEVERLAVSLSKLGRKLGSNTRYFSHHSSVSKELRLTAEEFAKGSKGELFTICCTSTLELGIDIGSVDSVVQYNAPNSVAAVGQRLGRSGRTTGKSILHFIATNEWDLLQGLAAITLYKEDKIDSIDRIIKPYDVMAHQIISFLLEKSGVKFDKLSNINKAFRCWHEIEDYEVKELLDFLIENNYIEILEDEAISGVETEKLLKGSEFFALFETEDNFNVYDGHNKIGELPFSPALQEGVNVYLAAGIWKIKDIEFKSRKIHVSKALDGEPPVFAGGGGDITDEIRKRMKEILSEESYWADYNDNIKKVLEKLADENLKHDYFHWVEKGDKIGLRTFRGTKINKALKLMLDIVSGEAGYTLHDRETFISGPNIKRHLKEVIKKNFSEDDLFNYLLDKPEMVESYLITNKYGKLIPYNLKIKYVIKNKLDLAGANTYLRYPCLGSYLLN